MDIKKLVEGLHPLERKVVPFLDKVKTLSELTAKSRLQEVEAMRALQWLENKKALKIVSTEDEFAELDSNGRLYAKIGLPERRLLLEVKSKPVPVDVLIKKLGNEEFGISVGILKQKAAISMVSGKISITENGKRLLEKESLEEALIKNLLHGAVEIGKFEAEDRFAFENLLKRKNIVQKKTAKIKFIELTDLGKQLSKQRIENLDFLESLTPEMIKSGQWVGKKFRTYDVKINVPEVSSAKRHFVNQAIEYMKKILLEMGFEEMTGNYCETSFWDLDALFVPQDHPARTMQDTFYVADEKGKILLGELPKDFKKVKEVHENGGSAGSKGWQTPWNENLAREILLRTHCTALSAHSISKLTKKDLPKKFFAIGKVFRNETMDWKHLFEFEQIEGIVVDENVNFRHLLGYLKQFFRKMGFTDVRLRPAHFPYTEPSVEVEVFNPVKKEWVELGGAGIFRPEVTKTLIGVEVPVLAWGLGLARIAAEYWNINDIRETYKNDLSYLKNLKVLMK
jgi:phenylalanyl-tRNA synthetase alpha chain